MVRRDVTVTAGGDTVAEMMIVMSLFATSYVHLERGAVRKKKFVGLFKFLLSIVGTVLGYTDLSIRRWKTIFFIIYYFFYKHRSWRRSYVEFFCSALGVGVEFLMLHACIMFAICFAYRD